ncbi:MAG: bile acid:sodium symporter family protein [Saprospiraceae bacterium]|nr:bile acid:sodium symporter family protein [Saprospiraceae bacterium]
MNLVLGLLMFGVALNLRLDDFKYIGRHKRLVGIGLSSQLLLLPILTIILIWVFSPPFSVALGMILIACCPGGNISNYFVHRSKGNTALSITLTSIVTIAAVVLTPISFYLWSSLIGKPADLDQSIHVEFAKMLSIMLQLILIPIGVGMYINHKLPKIQAAIEKPMKVLSLILLIGIIVFAVKDNMDIVLNHLDRIFILVLCHNGLAYLLGYHWARAFRTAEGDRRAIALETGIQNGGLGLILIFNYFEGLGGMALVAAWWGIWDIISGFVLSSVWNRKSPSISG